MAKIIKNKGNCKRVFNSTNGKWYGSVTETAIALQVKPASVSYAIKHETLCKGNQLWFEGKAYRYVPVMARNLTAATEENEVLRAKAEAWDRYCAEQEAKARAEAKAREEREKTIAKLLQRKERLEAVLERRQEQLNRAYSELESINMELELMNN